MNLLLGFVAVVAAALHVFAPAVLGSMDPLVKAIPAAILALFVLRGKRSPGVLLCGIGLAVSSVADALIEHSFLSGLVGFLVAHLFYIAAFTHATRRPRWLRLIPIAIWAAWALPILVKAANAMATPVLVYGVVIFVMIWRAAASVEKVGWNAGTLGLAGALFFGVSDTMLGFDRFIKPLPAAHLLIIGTYWLAQLLIASSFVRRGQG